MEIQNLPEIEDLYIDFPPTYDQYRKQKVEHTISAAINVILRLFYGHTNTLPSIPNLFIDIEKYKHMLDSDGSIYHFRKICTESIKACLSKLDPTIDIEVDKVEQSINIDIILYYDSIEYGFKLTNAQDRELLKIEYNKKPFYK